MAGTSDKRWDLVFLDPPYAFSDDDLSRLLSLLAGVASPEAVIVVERSSRSPEPSWPKSLSRFAERGYGETQLWFAEPSTID